MKEPKYKAQDTYAAGQTDRKRVRVSVWVHETRRAELIKVAKGMLNERKDQ